MVYYMYIRSPRVLFNSWSAAKIHRALIVGMTQRDKILRMADIHAAWNICTGFSLQTLGYVAICKVHPSKLWHFWDGYSVHNQTDIMQQTIRSLLKVRTAVVTDKYSTLHGTTDTVSLYEETQIHRNALDILPPSFTTSTQLYTHCDWGVDSRLLVHAMPCH